MSVMFADVSVVLPSAAGGLKLSNAFSDSKFLLSPSFSKSSPSSSVPRLGLGLGKAQTRSWKIRATASGSSGGDLVPVAPVQLESAVGQFLAQMLQTHPHLLPAAIEQQLDNLQNERDAQLKENQSSTKDVLQKRIAEVKEKERRKILEEILYCLIVHKFVENDISMIPKISETSDPTGNVGYWPNQEQKLESVHSPDAFEMIISHITIVLGERAVGPLDSIVQMSKIKLGKLYAASIMYGYFLKRVDERYQLERSVSKPPESFQISTNPDEPAAPRQLWDPDSLIEIYPEDGDREGFAVSQNRISHLPGALLSSPIITVKMYRCVSSRLSSLKARQGNRVLTRFSSSAAVATKPSGGLFSWITGDTSSSVTPLDFPLNDVKLSPPLPDYVEPAKTRITTLANGVKVASEASVNPAASIGLYVDCGSIYETPVSYGATHLLERMAFKSTLNRSHLRIVREIEAIGGNVTASASREHMIYTYDALKTYVPQMVEMLVDCVRNPAFLDWEVKEQLEKVKAEISEYSKNPQHLLLEAVHSAGYAGPYGNSLMATEATINRLNSTVLEEFVAANYTAPRMVLAASGVEHEEFLKVAEPLLSDLPKVSATEEPKPVYVGGDYRCQADAEMTHFALAFEVPGGWMSEKESMTLTVLQMLMGGGGSFSAGGPGKGMYSRLYLRVLNQYPQIHAFSAFSSIYNNTGLFGIQGTTGSDFGPQAVDVAVKELIAVANPSEVDQVQLNRAKQATKSAILMNLESRMVASEDIGRQLLTYGERKPVEHFLKAIDAVSAKDIASVVQKLISSPLTMASYGDVLSLPSYDAVSSRFRSK